jgi:hypothetical protein
MMHPPQTKAPPVTHAVIVRKRGPEPSESAAAPFHVLYDQQGHAFHRTREHGVLPHGRAHQTDDATWVRVRRGVDEILWVGDGRLELESVEFVGPRSPNTPTGHPGHPHEHEPAVVAPGASGDVAAARQSFLKTGPGAGSHHVPVFQTTYRPIAGRIEMHVLSSGVPSHDAQVGFYKATFIVDGLRIDPDFEVVP